MYPSIHKDDQRIRRNVVRLSRRNRTLLYFPPFQIQQQQWKNNKFNNDKEPKDEEQDN